MKLIANLVGAVLLCITGALTYLWYETNATVDRVVAELSPYARISYGSIVSSIYPGVLGIADATIRLDGQTLHADAITVRGRSLLDLYALQKNPGLFLVKHPDLKIDGLSSPTRLRKLPSFATLMENKPLQALANLNAAGCNGRSDISYGDLTAMGYSGLSSNILVKTGPEPFGRGWELQIDYRIAGIADYATNIIFKEAPRSLPIALERVSQLDVERIMLQIRDRGYNPRLLEYCAGEVGIDEQAYLQHHLAAVQNELEQHRIPYSDAMLFSYEEGLHRGALKRLRIQPKSDFAIEDLGFYKPGDYLELLGVRFSVNNRQATTRNTKLTTQQKPSGNLATAASPTTNTSAARPAPASTAMDWSELENVINKDIVVYTATGGQHRGQLENVDDYLLVLRKNIGAGSFSFTIDRRRFKNAVRIN